MRQSYLAIVDSYGLRALVPESAPGRLWARRICGLLPKSRCFWIVLQDGIAAVVRELLNEAEPRIALRLACTHAFDCGPLVVEQIEIENALAA